ncbi:hypothetical protein ACFTZI_20655 [Streptomyces decoyicus]|uniref:hypothetical protein n=1 Tax=Streptomyces decoyicus TaxID=249567 RepID=UPI00363DE120
MAGTVISLAVPNIKVVRRLAALEQIESSNTIQTRVTRDDNLLIIHSIASPVGEYWDVTYGEHLSDREIEELVDLEERVWKYYGVRLIDITVERQENRFPHPMFRNSKHHTYVRLCPKAAL